MKNSLFLVVALVLAVSFSTACSGGSSTPTSPSPPIGGSDPGVGGGGGSSGGSSVSRIQLVNIKLEELSDCTGCIIRPLVVTSDGRYGLEPLAVYRVYVELINPRIDGRMITVRVESDCFNSTPREYSSQQTGYTSSTWLYRGGYPVTNRVQDQYVTTVTVTETGPDLPTPTVYEKKLYSFLVTP